MKGTVYKQCWCRDPGTGKKLHKKCPDLKKKGHGKWYYRYDAPRAEGEHRRQPVAGPFDTKKDAEEDLSAALARVGGGGTAPDRGLKVAKYLADYQAAKRNLKQRTKDTNDEAFRLYWIPGLGGMRLADVRDHHVAQVIRAMELINQEVPDDEPVEIREMLRRMNAARAVDERRVVPEGETRRKKSRKPLSPARIERMFAPFRAACNAAVPRKIMFSPCAGVELPRRTIAKALAWTAPREAAYRKRLAKRLRDAEAAKGATLTTVERQDIWQDLKLRPSPVMVWMPSHAARFLEEIAGERLFALFCLAMFCGLRRDEVIGLTWPEIDLDGGFVYVLETGGEDGTKSESGTRPVPMADRVIRALRSWKKVQAAERLAWGPAWKDTGLAFTHEDGEGVTGQWVSVRFGWLAWRADMPPVRFHDLRHGAASLLKAAGYDSKYIAEVLGHSRSSFTDKAYILLFPDIARDAMNAAAAVVPGSERESS